MSFHRDKNDSMRETFSCLFSWRLDKERVHSASRGDHEPKKPDGGTTMAGTVGSFLLIKHHATMGWNQGFGSGKALPIWWVG